MFSRWSRLQKEGKLMPPTEKDDHDNELSDEDHALPSDECYYTELREAAISALPQWELGDWVAVLYDDNWYPGEVTGLNQNSIEVNCMKHSSQLMTNYFCWPSGKADILEYNFNDILCQISPPEPVNSRGRLDYALKAEDYSKAFEILRQCQ